MAFAYTAALQGRIALAVWNLPNASLNANQKTQLDGTWTTGALSGGVAYDAQIETASVAQYIEEVGNTSFPEPAWDRLFVSKAAMILAKTVRPDRYDQLYRDHEAALDWAIDTYTPDDIVSATITGQNITVAGIRKYTRSLCVKRKETGQNQGLRRRLFVSTSDIDSQIQWSMNYLWNMTLWNFRKRQVRLIIATAAFTTATWTESTKTLTATGIFTNTNIAAGMLAQITGGTSAITGEYAVATRTSDNAITLNTSLSSTAGNLATGDITGRVTIVSFVGLRSGETFDCIASNRLYYGTSGFGNVIRWVDSSEASMLKAFYESASGQPEAVRNENNGGIISWHFMPTPDTAYSLYGTVYIATPSMLDLAEINTAITKFPPELRTVLRDMVLARVLMQHGASDAERVWRRACEQAESLAPVYVDQGSPSRITSVLDVYGDFERLHCDGQGGAFGYG